jgi:hypothetical protein
MSQGVSLVGAHQCPRFYSRATSLEFCGQGPANAKYWKINTDSLNNLNETRL